MKRLLVSGTVLLAVAALTTASPQASSTAGGRTASSGNSSSEGFLKVNGTRLVYEDGTPAYFSGINYWGAMNLAADESAGGNQSRFQAEIAQLRSAGVNLVRIMAASEGAPTTQPFRMYPALMPAPNEWNEQIFVGLDRAVDAISKNGMKAILTLANTWNWSGGFGQYVSWVNNNEQIPYPPSWDPTLNPPYGDYTTNGTWDGYTAYAIQFYSSSAAQQIYRSHIARVINRINTVNGLAYKDDPTVIWEVANEPQPGWPDGWMEDTAAFIKSLAPRQLVTSGFEGKQGEAAWKAANGPSSIDFGCAHWWVQNQGIYDMLNSSSANLQAAVDSFTEFAANISNWSRDINKPTLMEEFGMARDNWENVARGAPNTNYLYAAEASITNRDVYFRHVITTTLEYFKNDSALVGTAPWSYGGIWKPTDGRNAFGQTWAGDPPHEAPGWYDVYSSDQSTLDLIGEQNRNASAAIAALVGNRSSDGTSTRGGSGSGSGSTGGARGIRPPTLFNWRIR